MQSSLLLILLLLFQSCTEVGERISPVLLKQNLLNSYDISESYQLNEKEHILIGREKTEKVEDEGHRLIYLHLDSLTNSYVKKYVSLPKGEAYRYKPYFYQFSNNDIIIVAEEGYEYMSGIDIYRLRDSNVEFLGYVPVSGDERDSVIEKLKVEKSNSKLKLSFKGQIEYEVATDNIMDGDNLTILFDNSGMKVNLK